MKALRLAAAGKLELADIARPEPGEGELLIETGASTICTSDLNDIRSNPFGISLPVIIGHEGSGTVAAVGRKVKGFKPGDRITAHPVHPCGKCPNCRTGKRHLCADLRHFGINLQGTFAEYFTVRQDRARKIPRSLDFATAALAEPVCVCLEALERAGLREGDALLITGDGPFGLVIARLARKLALSRLVITGHHDFRLAFAKGAAAVNLHTAADPFQAVMDASGGAGYDAAILAVGSARAVADGIRALKARGRLVVFSAIAGETPVDLFSVHVKELEIRGSCNDDDMLDGAVRMLAVPELALRELVTHRMRIGDYAKAFELAERGKDSAIKVAITFLEESS